MVDFTGGLGLGFWVFVGGFLVVLVEVVVGLVALVVFLMALDSTTCVCSTVESVLTSLMSGLSSVRATGASGVVVLCLASPRAEFFFLLEDFLQTN